MVEGQRRQLPRTPAQPPRVAAGLHGHLVRRNDGEISDAHDQFTRIAVRSSKRANLIQITLGQTGLPLAQLTQCDVLEILLDLHKAAGQRPPSAKWLESALDQEDLQRSVPQGEDHEIDSDAGCGCL